MFCYCAPLTVNFVLISRLSCLYVIASHVLGTSTLVADQKESPFAHDIVPRDYYKRSRSKLNERSYQRLLSNVSAPPSSGQRSNLPFEE